MKGLLVVDVTRVEVISGRTVHLWFSDGSERVVDLTPFLWGPVFAQLADDDVAFNRVFIASSIGTIDVAERRGHRPGCPPRRLRARRSSPILTSLRLRMGWLRRDVGSPA